MARVFAESSPDWGGDSAGPHARRLSPDLPERTRTVPAIGRAAAGSAARVLALQRAVGNRAVAGVMSGGQALQRHSCCAPCAGGGGCEHSARNRPLSSEEVTPVQRAHGDIHGLTRHSGVGDPQPEDSTDHEPSRGSAEARPLQCGSGGPAAHPVPVAFSGASAPVGASSVLQRQRSRNVLRHKRGWGTIDSPALLGLWAKDVGMQKLKVGRVLRTLQEAPGTENQQVDALRAKLLRSLVDSQEFEGSPEARKDAAEALDMRWDWISPFLASELRTWYVRQFIQAVGRAPQTAQLETRPAEIARINRRALYDHPMTETRYRDKLVVGKVYPPRRIIDIKRAGTKGPRDLPELWFSILPHESWYYLAGSGDDFDWFLADVSGQVVSNTKFAAELFPWMLKIAGFSLGLSSRLAVLVASEVVSALGEQGLADARRGAMKSGWEVLQDATLGVFIGHVTNRMFGRPGETELSGAVEQVVEKSADKGRRIVAATDASEVEAALRAGKARPVTDPGLRAEGYRIEVEVVSEGQRHTWRQLEGSGWCRFSGAGLCVGSLGDEVAEAARQHRPNIELDLSDLQNVGLSKRALNRVGGSLSSDAIVAKVAQRPGSPLEKSTDWIRVARGVPRGGDEFMVNLGSAYGLSKYIRYHIRAPGLGAEGFPILLAPEWMNHAANRIEGFMRMQFAKGNVIVNYRATRTSFTGEELRPFIDALLLSKDKKILSRLANDAGRIEPFLKKIVYEVEVYERVGSHARVSYYRATTETGVPPTGAVGTVSPISLDPSRISR